jgi:hypothetical protein
MKKSFTLHIGVHRIRVASLPKCYLMVNRMTNRLEGWGKGRENMRKAILWGYLAQAEDTPLNPTSGIGMWTENHQPEEVYHSERRELMIVEKERPRTQKELLLGSLIFDRSVLGKSIKMKDVNS